MSRGTEENIFKSVLFLENLPQHLKMRERGRKKMRRKAKRIFSNVQCFIVIPFPSILKNYSKGRKKREKGRNKMHREGKENILKGARTFLLKTTFLMLKFLI